MYLYATIFLYLTHNPFFTVAENLHAEGIFCYKHAQTEEFPIVTYVNHI